MNHNFLRNRNLDNTRSIMKQCPDLLEKGSEHIYYEVRMLLEPYKSFKQNKYPNEYIELSLLHLRILFNFFYTEKIKYPDDTVFLDYLDVIIKFDNINFDETGVNKYLAHLTYSRCFGTPSWPLIEYTEKIIKNCRIFYNSLPDDYKNWQWFLELNNIIKIFESLF